MNSNKINIAGIFIATYAAIVFGLNYFSSFELSILGVLVLSIKVWGVAIICIFLLFVVFSAFAEDGHDGRTIYGYPLKLSSRDVSNAQKRLWSMGLRAIFTSIYVIGWTFITQLVPSNFLNSREPQMVSSVIVLLILFLFSIFFEKIIYFLCRDQETKEQK